MPTITFSERSVGTRNPTFSFDENTVRTSGQIVRDGAQPASPSFAANSNYFGPVFLFFERAVTSVSLAAGYFDNLGSTRIEFLDGSGRVLSSILNSAFGVQTYSFTSEAGIASVRVIDESYDAAGFSIDTVIFGDPVASLSPPVVSQAAGALLLDRDFGQVGPSSLVFSEELGPGDSLDTIAFTAAAPGAITLTVALDSDPQNIRAITFAVTEGRNYFSFRPPEAYTSDQSYTVRMDVDIQQPDAERLMDAWISDTAAAILGGTFDFQEAKFDLLEIAQRVDSPDGAARLLGKVAGVYSLVGLVFDASVRTSRVRNAEDFREEFFVQAFDAATETLVSSGPAAVGAMTRHPIGIALGIVTGFVGGVAYTVFFSDDVQDYARTLYRESFQSLDDLPYMYDTDYADSNTAPISFDADYYLDTYADAATAVANGDYATAYLHYIGVGAALGYAPAEGVAPIPASAIASETTPELARQGYNSALFIQAAGDFSGDTASATEIGIAATLNDARTAGSELGLSGALFTLANRIAQDVAVNRLVEPSVAFTPTDLQGWIATMSNGQAIPDAFASYLGGSANLQFFAVYSDDVQPEDILSRFLADAEAAPSLLGTSIRSIGIGEHAGVYVIAVSTSVAGSGPAEEAAPRELVLAGDEGADTFYAGGGVANLTGRDGADMLVGSAYADRLDGGAGDDVIRTNGGADIVFGGSGNDRFIIDSGSAPVDRPDIVKLVTQVNGTRETAIALEGGFDLVSDWRIADSATIPHATVNAVSSSGREFYAVTVAQGATIVIDIDRTTDFDSALRIVDSAGQTISANATASVIDPGSDFTYDAYLTHTFEAGGTYYIEVTNERGEMPAGSSYTMNVSLTGATIPSLSAAATVYGGTGDDVYEVAGAGDLLVEYAGGGTDTVLSRVSYTLGANIENLTLVSGSGAVEAAGNDLDNLLRGNAADNVIRGGAGDDILVGSGGNDAIDGGAGTDTAVFSGNRSDYTIFNIANGQVQQISGPDGVDTLFSVERLAFDDGIYALGAQAGELQFRYDQFGAGDAAGGWSSNERYPRTVADVNGDGRADLIGFASSGTFVALGQANGTFAPLQLGIAGFGSADAAGGWADGDRFPRTMGDVNGDGRADIIGFGSGGAYVSYGQASGTFAAPVLALAGFGSADAAGGWLDNTRFPREVADVNGDGRDDLIGFGGAGVYVSLARADGGFGNTYLATNSFGFSQSAGGWSNNDLYQRTLADINGDGRADIVGFGSGGGYISYALENGTYTDPVLGYSGFGSAPSAGGWLTQDRFPRMLGDLNGDGAVDIVGFSSNGTWVALGDGEGGFSNATLATDQFGYGDAAGGWATNDRFPRILADINGDGTDDIVGFSSGGVVVAYGGTSDWVRIGPALDYSGEPGFGTAQTGADLLFDVASNQALFGELRDNEVHLPSDRVLHPVVFDEGSRELLIGPDQPVFRFENSSRWGRASVMESEVELVGLQVFDAPDTHVVEPGFEYGAASAALRALQAEENLLGDALHQPPVVSPIAPELEPLIDNIALF